MQEQQADQAEEAIGDPLKPMVGRSIAGEGDLIEALRDFYIKNPNIIGAGDILSITGGKPAARAGMVAAILSRLATEGGKRAIKRFVIIVPPWADAADAREQAWEALSRCFAKLLGCQLAGREEAWFRDHPSVTLASDGRHATLLALIAGQAERTAVIVTEAGEYRDDAIVPFIPEKAETPLMSEDVWAPQVHALAEAAVAPAAHRRLYVALDTNEQSPTRPQLGDLLRSIEAFGVMVTTADESAAAILAGRVDDWN